MPSFDVVSEVDKHELANAVDQANREVANRFDFKGTDSRIELEQGVMTLHADSEFRIEQMQRIVHEKLAKRGIDVGCLDAREPEVSLNRVRQKLIVREGIERELAKKLVKLIKDTKLKVQASVQGEQIRVTG